MHTDDHDSDPTPDDDGAASYDHRRGAPASADHHHA
jgi:hypothetical protein